MTRCQGIRRGGSAALDLCYLACGRLDGFRELKLNPWGTAADSLILNEAGAGLAIFLAIQLLSGAKKHSPLIASFMMKWLA